MVCTWPRSTRSEPGGKVLRAPSVMRVMSAATAPRSRPRTAPKISSTGCTDPLAIIGRLPAALAGMAWMLFATDTTISVPALTGAIMCVGIATANSILVVSRAREVLAEGKPPLEAAFAAGVGRFRPVVMTALAMLFGMVPMALGSGGAGAQNAPLGRTVMGGLACGTVATLVLVPVFFAMLHTWLGARSRTTPGASSSSPSSTDPAMKGLV